MPQVIKFDLRLVGSRINVDITKITLKNIYINTNHVICFVS